MKTKIQRKLEKNTFGQIVIQFSAIILFLCAIINYSYGQTNPAGMSPVTPLSPYDSLDASVVITVDGDTVTYDNNILNVTSSVPTLTTTIYDTELAVLSFTHSASVDYIFGLMTNNGNSDFYILGASGGLYTNETIQITNTKSNGYAAGIIYISDTQFDGGIESFALDITSAGEAVGVSIAPNGSMGGILELASVDVESTNTGAATGIVTGQLKGYVNTYNSYSEGVISAATVNITANRGDATGVAISKMEGSSLELEDVTVESKVTGNATGITIGQMKGYLLASYGSYSSYYSNVISADNVNVTANSGDATGVSISRIGLEFDSGNSYYSIYDVNGNYGSTLSLKNVTVESKNIGNATGIFVEDVSADRIETSYQTYTFASNITAGDVEVTAGSGDAIGVWLGGTISANGNVYIIGNDVEIGDITVESTNSGSAIGMRVENVSGIVDVGDIKVTANRTNSGVYGFVIDGTIAPPPPVGSTSTSGGTVDVGEINVTTYGGSGNAYGLVSKGAIISVNPYAISNYNPRIYGNLIVDDNINVIASGTSTGGAVGIDLGYVQTDGDYKYTALTIDGAILAKTTNTNTSAWKPTIANDAYGIRIGDDSPAAQIVVANNIKAESVIGDAVGIFSSSKYGNNEITIDTSDSYNYLPKYVQITGKTNDGFNASIYLNGENNTLNIGESIYQYEKFTNDGQEFLVYGAHNINFNVDTEFTNNTAFVGSKNVTINRNLTLDANRGNWFDPLTEAITIASGMEADFGASEFTNVGNRAIVTITYENSAKVDKKIITVDSNYDVFNMLGIFNIGDDEIAFWAWDTEAEKQVIEVYKPTAITQSNPDGIIFDRTIEISQEEVTTDGLLLTANGKGKFHRDQIFEGIAGRYTGVVEIDGDAKFIAPGNYTFNGTLKATSVTVNKTHVDPTTLGSTPIGSHADFGTQEIGILETGLLTIESGTLQIIDNAEITGLSGSSAIGKLTGGNAYSQITIDTQGKNYEYGGYLQMGYITKEGAGKQTIGRLETSEILTINDGELAITDWAITGGVENVNSTGASRTLTVDGKLTLDIGVDEIIKSTSSPTYSKTRVYKYIQHERIFEGDLVAGTVEKLGKGIQQFDTITADVVTFGAAKFSKDGEQIIDAKNFSEDNNLLINIGTLIATDDLRTGGELIATNWAVLGGIEGEEGKLSGGDFTINADKNHNSKVDIEVANLTKSGQGQQIIKSLKTENLFINKGSIKANNNVYIENGIDGKGGLIGGVNVILNGSDNKDHYFGGDLEAYNFAKNGSGLQTFNKLDAKNDIYINGGHVKVNQIYAQCLTLESNTTLELEVVPGLSPSYIGTTGALDGKISIHGQARANTVALEFNSLNLSNFKIAFEEVPDQFITWRVGRSSIFAEANKHAVMSELYLSSLLLHDHRSAWNSVVKRLNQSLPPSAMLFRDNSPRASYSYWGQSPYYGNSDKSLWVNYIGRTGHHKSSFYDAKFKLRSDGIQVGYDIIPSMTFQYGLLFGYEGQSSTISRDKVTADDTYIGLYGAKTLSRGFDLRAIINYGHQSYTSIRYARNAANYNKATYNGDTVEGIFEVGRRYSWNRQLTLRPVFAIELYYNMINRTSENDQFNTNAAVDYDLATLKQTLLRFGSDWNYEIQQFVVSGGLYYTLNCGTDKLSTIVADDLGQRLPLKGSKLGRSILTVDLGGQYYINDLQTRSIFANYSGNIYPDRKGTPITGTVTIGFQFDF
jgi:hypothetical protein